MFDGVSNLISMQEQDNHKYRSYNVFILSPTFPGVCDGFLYWKFALPIAFSNIKIVAPGIDRLCSGFNINPAHIFPLNCAERNLIGWSTTADEIVFQDIP